MESDNKQYKKTKIGKIPWDWRVLSLKNTADIKFSNVDKKTFENEQSVFLCNYLDVYNNDYITRKINFMPATATEMEINKFTLLEGDILLTKDSETQDDIAIPSVVIEDLENVICGYHLAMLRPNPKLVQSIFLSKLLLSKSVNNQFIRLAHGLTRFGLNISAFKKVVIPVPPLLEQRKIAEILSTVDADIEKTDAIIKETQQLKKGLMQKLFTKGIGHTRFKKTKIGRIPEEWSVKKFADLLNDGIMFEVQDGNHGNYHPKSSDYVSSGIPFIMANNLKNGTIDLENCKFIRKEQADNLRIGFSKPHDVLLSHKGTIGRVSIVPDVPDYIMLTPQITYYRIGNSEQLLNIFLRYYFESEKYQATLLRLSEQSTRKYVGITEQKKMYMILPPITEQYKITYILSEVDDKIINEQNYKSELEQLKKGLLQVLLTGKVRVKV